MLVHNSYPLHFLSVNEPIRSWVISVKLSVGWCHVDVAIILLFEIVLFTYESVLNKFINVFSHSLPKEVSLLENHHHHVVPSTLSRLAVMDLHSIWSLALHTHSPYLSPVQTLMLSIHIILGLPCPLCPSIFPSSNNLCIPFCLIKCLKYILFLLLTT